MSDSVLPLYCCFVLLLYRRPMVEMVACVLKHRLAPGGRALLCCAVREQVSGVRGKGSGTVNRTGTLLMAAEEQLNRSQMHCTG